MTARSRSRAQNSRAAGTTNSNFDVQHGHLLPLRAKPTADAHSFFARVCDYLWPGSEAASTKMQARAGQTVAVAHLIPDVVPYLEHLSRVTFLRGVLPKPKSIDETVRRYVAQDLGIKVLNPSTRENIMASPDSIVSLFRDDGRPAMLLDIGGYFAGAAEYFAVTGSPKIRGIVEDTQNGLLRYEAVSQGLRLPVISIAQSPLKGVEDWAVGLSIVFSADSVLRSLQGALLTYRQVGVIGYGKVGSSIARHLLQVGAKPMVFDVDPFRMVEAASHNCTLSSKEALLGQCDVVFCATGQGAIAANEWAKVKSAAVLFSVTSADDEFGTSLTTAIGSRVVILSTPYGAPLVESCTTTAGGQFLLVSQGNAVNFVHGAVCGDFIHLARAEMLAAMKLLFEQELRPGLHDNLPGLDDIRSRICLEWLKAFRPNIGF